jgi:hypothetical protein
VVGSLSYSSSQDDSLDPANVALVPSACTLIDCFWSFHNLPKVAPCLTMIRLARSGFI